MSTQPSAMCAAPMQYERSTTSSSGSPAATRTSTRSIAPASVDDDPRARRARPLGDPRPRTCRAAPRATRSSCTSAARSTPASCERALDAARSCSASPSRAARATGGPATAVASSRVALVDRYGDAIGGRRPHRRRRPCRRCAPSPSRHTALAAIGGRFGPSRTKSSREYTTRTVAPSSVGELARAATGASDVDLAAERAAVRERRRGLAAGLAPRRVGLEVGGLDPARREAHAARRAAAAAASGGALVDRRAPALHLARERPRFEQRLGHDPVTPAASTAGAVDPAAAAPRPARRAARGRRRTAVAERHAGPDALRRRRPRARPAAPRRRDRRRAPTAPRAAAATSIAS